MNFADISCFLNRLKIKQKILEKNGCDFLKSINENYGIVLDDNNILLKALNDNQLFTLKKDVQENNKILQELKCIVSPENIPKIDLLALKHKMLTLENSIQNIKKHITKDVEDLIKEENILSIEVTNLEIKYSDTNRKRNETNKVALTSTNRKIENPSLYQEVIDFANFVNENGGHEGGWSQNDHLIFLKYYQQIKSRKMLFKILHRFLPDFSEEKISNHICWYTEYIALREKQKNALEEWRRNKIKMSKNPAYPAEETEEKLQSPVEKKNQNNNQLQRDHIKEKIHKWKLEKQQKLQQDTENKLKTQWQRESKKKMKHDTKNEKRSDVGKWRASKQAQEKAEQLEKEVMSLKEKERKIMIANALIREFQKQDSLYIMRRINKHNKRTSNFFPSIRKENRKKYRDPERIFKATRQWLSRISCPDSNENTAKGLNTLFNKGPLNVQQIPKLCIPNWRLAAK